MSFANLNLLTSFLRKHTMNLLLLCVVGAYLLLCACSPQAYTDPYAKYRQFSSAQLFSGASTDLVKKNYLEAINQYAALDAMYPFGAYTKKAQLYIIYAYYKNDDMVSTEVAADRYIRLYPLGKSTDYAYYMKSNAQIEQGVSWYIRKMGYKGSEHDMSSMMAAYKNLYSLTQLFPKSKYFHAAVVRMRYIRNMAAQKNLSIASYYFKRRSYVAVINRCLNIIETIPGSSVVPKALLLMVKTYNKLGLPKLAAQYQRLYNRSYSA